jgi:hypothetical protein
MTTSLNVSLNFLLWEFLRGFGSFMRFNLFRSSIGSSVDLIKRGSEEMSIKIFVIPKEWSKM